MARVTIIGVGLVLVVLIGGGIFLASWNIPAPTTHVEKPVADNKLPQ